MTVPSLTRVMSGAPLAAAGGMLTVTPHDPPAWARVLRHIPKTRVRLAMTPTPVHRWHLPGVPEGCEVYVKRDDLTGAQLSGNKVRKLEFLLADALARDADCVVTIGAVQSNHARATAVAARYLGLDAHLVLRAPQSIVDAGDPGMDGNLMIERAAGARVHLVSKRDYAKIGGPALGEGLRRRLEREGRKPYVVPVGGSDALGTWGYVRMMDELDAQLRDGDGDGDRDGFFTDVAMACGSGGTTAGVALGCALCPTLASVRVRAYGVCDTPEYHREFVRGILRDMGADADAVDRAVGAVDFVQAKGLGYAMSTDEEMRVAAEVAATTGIVLDPTYGGKAVATMLREMKESPRDWTGRRVLFVHTGGAAGMYAAIPQLWKLVHPAERYRLEDAETNQEE